MRLNTPEIGRDLLVGILLFGMQKGIVFGKLVSQASSTALSRSFGNDTGIVTGRRRLCKEG